VGCAFITRSATFCDLSSAVCNLFLQDTQDQLAGLIITYTEPLKVFPNLTL